jgi:hypothetical protein
MSGAIPLLPLYTYVARAGITCYVFGNDTNRDYSNIAFMEKLKID